MPMALGQAPGYDTGTKPPSASLPDAATTNAERDATATASQRVREKSPPSERLMTLAPFWAAWRMPAAVSDTDPSPKRSRTFTGRTDAFDATPATLKPPASLTTLLVFWAMVPMMWVPW